jgi:hypothetical protein
MPERINQMGGLPPGQRGPLPKPPVKTAEEIATRMEAAAKRNTERHGIQRAEAAARANSPWWERAGGDVLQNVGKIMDYYGHPPDVHAPFSERLRYALAVTLPAEGQRQVFERLEQAPDQTIERRR